MEWKKIKSPKQQISNFFGSQGSHIDYSSFPRHAWVLKWKLVFFSFGRQICITVPERKHGEMEMKIASLQLKKRANALIVFRFREKQNTERLQRKNDSYTPLTTPTMKVSSVLGKGRSTNSMS